VAEKEVISDNVKNVKRMGKESGRKEERENRKEKLKTSVRTRKKREKEGKKERTNKPMFFWLNNREESSHLIEILLEVDSKLISDKSRSLMFETKTTAEVKDRGEKAYLNGTIS
jgi:hypothetical protein